LATRAGNAQGRSKIPFVSSGERFDGKPQRQFISITQATNHRGVSMTSFDQREKGFEKKFAHDAELKFKAEARRNRLLGAWAAKELGLGGAEADAYVKAVIKSDLEKPGDDDVFAKIRNDFDAKGVKQTEAQIRTAMGNFLAEAVGQIEKERA
jgi:hypothetical protein